MKICRGSGLVQHTYLYILSKTHCAQPYKTTIFRDNLTRNIVVWADMDRLTEIHLWIFRKALKKLKDSRFGGSK